MVAFLSNDYNFTSIATNSRRFYTIFKRQYTTGLTSIFFKKVMLKSFIYLWHCADTLMAIEFATNLG